ncbi:hypothetical protein [Moorena sp. SIO4G3]|uniref:hypothetical protein n=1 Tax=Moorena sp. SIO4G3 TaxID=2607821 RepID=UPI00142CB3A8|nr:hypothetical protein [Moorena sp. SIO4G3]NEO82291.1 hypothetical protein [Moorena sp. SIO4G3]
MRYGTILLSGFIAFCVLITPSMAMAENIYCIYPEDLPCIEFLDKYDTVVLDKSRDYTMEASAVVKNLNIDQGYIGLKNKDGQYVTEELEGDECYLMDWFDQRDVNERTLDFVQNIGETKILVTVTRSNNYDLLEAACGSTIY